MNELLALVWNATHPPRRIGSGYTYDACGRCGSSRFETYGYPFKRRCMGCGVQLLRLGESSDGVPSRRRIDPTP